MTKQSAQEALTMGKNYLHNLIPSINVSKNFSEFLDQYSIHHQLISASYNVGGTSAGYALAINSLSAIFQIPIFNDFGITGVPWTKGTKSEKIGGSVIIGGHKKKIEKVLMYLNRMLMPLQNYMDFSDELLKGYWTLNKDVIGVSSFDDLMPEVLWLGKDYEKILNELIALRIKYKLNKYYVKEQSKDIEIKITDHEKTFKIQFENEILRRFFAIKSYLVDTERDPYLTHNEIFQYHSTDDNNFLN